MQINIKKIKNNLKIEINIFNLQNNNINKNKSYYYY